MTISRYELLAKATLSYGTKISPSFESQISLNSLTRSDFRAAVNHSDLAAQLVYEDHGGLGLAHRPRDLPHGFGHQLGLLTHLLVPHIAFQLG